jgi:hypothetical protein
VLPCRPSPVRPSALGLRFESFLPFEEWKSLGKKVGTHASASAWWIGDWICFGRAMYGRRYRSALTVTGLDYQTLRNYASVARRFEVSRRRYNLTFQHHAVVRALTDDQQDRWLTLAEKNRWSRNELRRTIRASKRTGERSSTPDASASPDAWGRRPLTVNVPPSNLVRWRAEAEKAGLNLQDWVVAAVERSLSTRGPTNEPARRRSVPSSPSSALGGSRRRSARPRAPKAA